MLTLTADFKKLMKACKQKSAQQDNKNKLSIAFVHVNFNYTVKNGVRYQQQYVVRSSTHSIDV